MYIRLAHRRGASGIFKSLTPGSKHMATEDAGIYAREFDVIDRYIQIGVASSKVLRVTFPETPEEGALSEHPLLDRLEAYLTAREEDGFDDVQVALTVPTDQRRVLESVRDVPFGKSIDMDALTRMTSGLSHEDDADLETVRTALRENPAPIFVPDHRIVNASGATPPEVAERLRSIEGL